MPYKTLFIAVVGLVLIFAGFFYYRKNYRQYNLLRLDPLEESVIDLKLLATNSDTSDIWLLGDSRIAHWDKKLFSRVLAHFVNLGVEGQTSGQVLNRFKNHLEWGTPDWVILEVGINDLKVIGVEKRLAGKIAEKCYHNIVSILELCNKKSIRVICCSIFPNGNIELTRRLVWDPSIDRHIVELNKQLNNYCQTNKVEYFDTYPILSGDNGKVKGEFQNGFLHVNEQAYAALTRQLLTKFGDKLASKSQE